METRLMVARFAGQGYIVVAADYIGKGISNEPDAWLVQGATAQACLDMWLAAQAVCAREKADHRGTFLFSVNDEKNWFDELRKASP